ncbi:MAG: hypothetical protein O2992_13730 [Gemmatimonadetes bacterium]|nr:hypothetical protein [Gemmatimonadota bacterium]
MTPATTKFTRSGLALALALALGACADTTGLDSFSDEILYDMAIVAADATIEDVNSWAQPMGFARGLSELRGIPGMGGSGVPRGMPGGHKGIGGALSGTREATFFDASGSVQDAYDAETTAMIHFVSEVGGDVSRDNWSATLARGRDMTVTGLAGTETHRTFNGSGSEDVSRSRHTEEGDRAYAMSGSFTYADVVTPIPGSDPKYPTSGTITRNMTATRTGTDGSETRTVAMMITFDGDETASITVNGETMEIDLTTREGRNPLRKKRGGSGG